MKLASTVVVLVLAAVTALPNPDQVILKGSSELRYDYKEDGDGNLHLVDQWLKVSDVQAASRYNPDVQNILHLFTRQNPSVSQPILLGSNNLLSDSNFDPMRRTAVIVHGWMQTASSNVNGVLVPAFLQAEDMNVIVLDWSSGAGLIAGADGPVNAVAAGLSLSRMIDWICQRTGTSTNTFHLVGFSLGAHLVGVAGRNVNGRIPYITALDPGANMEESGHIFGPDAATYTEAIHTNSFIMGHGNPVAHVDFYPNGGDLQPGCGVNFLCNHYRSFFFFAETLTTTGGWVGTRCLTQAQAILGACVSLVNVRMGGLQPKFGSLGLYHLRTNAEPPFWSS